MSIRHIDRYLVVCIDRSPIRVSTDTRALTITFTNGMRLFCLQMSGRNRDRERRTKQRLDRPRSSRAPPTPLSSDPPTSSSSESPPRLPDERCPWPRKPTSPSRRWRDSRTHTSPYGFPRAPIVGERETGTTMTVCSTTHGYLSRSSLHPLWTKPLRGDLVFSLTWER